MPTLFTAGELDEVGPAHAERFADKVRGSRYAIRPGAAHITTGMPGTR